MNKVIKTIVYLIVALTVVFYGGAFLLPAETRVERSIDIAAPPEQVFTIAGDLRKWPDWSVLTETDPGVAYSFEGLEQPGVGQRMRWASNNPVAGNGMLTVTEHVPGRRVVHRVDYGAFGTATSALGFEGVGGGTRVTWVYRADLPGVVDRWAGLMVDRQAGAEHDKALAKLKALVEAATPVN